MQEQVENVVKENIEKGGIAEGDYQSVHIKFF